MKQLKQRIFGKCATIKNAMPAVLPPRAGSAAATTQVHSELAQRWVPLIEKRAGFRNTSALPRCVLVSY
ncbi:MAG: hypothetical protein R3C26_21970 [Calditrichia bacterium]